MFYPLLALTYVMKKQLTVKGLYKCWWNDFSIWRGTPEAKYDWKSGQWDEKEMASLNLPKPHVPDLNVTLKRYTDGLRPVLPAARFADTRKCVQHFVHSGEGAKLQEKLIQFANQCDNWVTRLWMDDMYLTNPLALPVNSSPYYLLPKQTFHSPADRIKFAARVVAFCYQFKDKIEKQTLSQEFASGHASGKALCMQTYNNFFGSCRLPCEEKDHFHVASGDFFVIAYASQFYSVHLERDERMSPSTLEKVIARIIASAGATNSPPVGLLTSENRRTWSALRHQLIQLDKDNKRSLEQLQECAFILCLDDETSPQIDADCSRDESETSFRAYQLLTGGGTNCNSCNRWYDKFLNFVVSSDGICGAVIEHSGSEGITVIRFLHELLSYLKMNECDSEDASFMSLNQIDCKFHHLRFVLDDSLLHSLGDSREKLDKLLRDVDLRIVKFDSFGKDFIKNQNMSPDAFIQMSLQLTYYREHGKLVSSYESAGLRHFAFGRVDNIRSCSRQALHWVRVMCDEVPHVTESQRIDSFKQAMAKQVEILKYTIAGDGPENHLLGLREMARNGDDSTLPPLFRDKSYREYLNFKLSTSQLPSHGDIFIGYGAVVNDGYGCSYNPTRDTINFSIASFHSCPETSSTSFAASLVTCLLQMRDMCLSMQQTN